MPTSTVLEGQTVHEIFKICQLKTGEETSGSITAPGIIHDREVKFSSSRIEQNCQVIHDLLSQLPDKFKSSSGESFEETHLDRRGTNWSRIPVIREQLIQLGVAIGEVQLLGELNTWARLSGGMPRLVITQ
jgi:hypothetical protein